MGRQPPPQKLSKTSEAETAQFSVTIFPFKKCGRLFAGGILPTADVVVRGKESLFIRERREMCGAAELFLILKFRAC